MQRQLLAGVLSRFGKRVKIGDARAELGEQTGGIRVWV